MPVAYLSAYRPAQRQYRMMRRQGSRAQLDDRPADHVGHR
jgi:hypothetical protein